VTLVVAVVAVVGADDANEKIMFEGCTFEWPCSATKSLFKNTGRYIPKNILGSKVAIYKDDAIVALPRYEMHKPIRQINKEFNIFVRYFGYSAYVFF